MIFSLWCFSQKRQIPIHQWRCSTLQKNHSLNRFFRSFLFSTQFRPTHILYKQIGNLEMHFYLLFLILQFIALGFFWWVLFIASRVQVAIVIRSFLSQFTILNVIPIFCKITKTITYSFYGKQSFLAKKPSKIGSSKDQREKFT